MRRSMPTLRAKSTHLRLRIFGNKPISGVMVKNRPTINIIPLCTLLAVGLTIDNLKHTSGHPRLDQSEQRPLEKIAIKSHFDEIEGFDEFLVINMNAYYKMLLGRPRMQKNVIVPSTYHYCVKYLLQGGQGTVTLKCEAYQGFFLFFALLCSPPPPPFFLPPQDEGGLPKSDQSSGCSEASSSSLFYLSQWRRPRW